MKRQKTFDDAEPVLESTKPTEPYVAMNKLKPRPRTALQVYDEIQAARLVEEDPLFPE